MDNILPNLNPHEYNVISQITSDYGTIILMGLNNDLRLSGNSLLPA